MEFFVVKGYHRLSPEDKAMSDAELLAKLEPERKRLTAFNKIITAHERIPFGKFKGWYWSSLPSWYTKWLLAKHPQHKATIAKYCQ